MPHGGLAELPHLCCCTKVLHGWRVTWTEGCTDGGLRGWRMAWIKGHMNGGPNEWKAAWVGGCMDQGFHGSRIPGLEVFAWLRACKEKGCMVFLWETSAKGSSAQHEAEAEAGA